MAKKVIMPKQGLQMTEGTIMSWLVKEGEVATEGEPLFEMETDKLTITMDSPASGTLLKITRGEGETVPITELIAVIGEPGEDISALLSEAAPSAASATAEEAPAEAAAPAETAAPQTVQRAEGERVFITPRAKMTAEENGIDYSSIAGSGTDGMIIESDVIAYIESGAKATPLAKKVAAQSDVKLEDVAGTGARGKIVKDDILAAVAARAAGGAGRGETLVPLVGMRKVIADRMRQSMETAAQTSHRISVDMTEAANLRVAFKKQDKRVSYNDIVSLAVCRALKDYPIMNAQMTDDGILMKDYVNLGIAVAIDNGLIVPVINDADLMTVEEIGIMTREMAAKAKNGTLKPDEYKGGTFTISNLGMFGLDSFVAIINQPESGILAVGAIKKTPVVLEGDEIAVRPIMSLTLSYDHRIVDGAPAAEFLSAVKAYLEQPYLLL